MVCADPVARGPRCLYGEIRRDLKAQDLGGLSVIVRDRDRCEQQTGTEGVDSPNAEKDW